MPVTHEDPFIRELMERLGIPKHTRAFSLHVRAGDVVKVDVEYFPTPDAPMTEQKRFTLEEIQ